MKKNVVFMACVVNKDRVKKYGNFDYFDYSIKTWEYWCEKNNCEFVLFDEPFMEDTKKYRINWQKEVFVFDVLEKRKIDYDQILILDSTCMIKWNTPNFFDLTDHKFTVTKDSDNLSWIYSSSQTMLKNNLWFDIKELSNWKDDILTGAQELDLLSPMTIGVKLKTALDINQTPPDLHTNTNPIESYNESFCAIVNETRFAQATGLLTEKIMNPMLNCKPFIMVGPPGNLEYMRKWGFQTFSDYWDESYDTEECHHKRLAKILDLINEIGSKSLEELQELYEKMLPVTMFNQVHILDLQEKLLEEPITKNIIFKRLG